MGNESSSEYSIESKHDVVLSAGCTLYDAVSADQSSQLSVFSYTMNNDNELYVENATKYLKTLRHPNILRFHAVKYSGFYKQQPTAEIITERVLPLESVLESMTSDEILAGIHDVAEALSFLHDRADSCHNALSIGSVFVSACDGIWKLGGFEYTSRCAEASLHYLSRCRRLRPESSITPEEKSGEISMDRSYNRDVYAFGKLAAYLLEYITSRDPMLESFLSFTQDKCLSVNPAERPELSVILNHGVFTNDFIKISGFLKQVTMKTGEEKKEFFKTLVQRLRNLPEELVGRRLVKPLMSRFVVLEPESCQHLMPHLLAPRNTDNKEGCRSQFRSELDGLLCDQVFRVYVIPELYKIFHVRDVHVRVVLLTHFHRYVRLFERSVLQRVIFPQILISLRDASEDLVTLSLRALADLVPLLGADVVIGANRAKLFSQGTPRFTNHNGMIDHRHNDNNQSSREQRVSIDSWEAVRAKKREEFKRRAMERKMGRETKKVETEIRRMASNHKRLESNNSVEVKEARDPTGEPDEQRTENRRNSGELENRMNSVNKELTDTDVELEIEQELLALESKGGRLVVDDRAWDESAVSKSTFDESALHESSLESQREPHDRQHSNLTNHVKYKQTRGIQSQTLSTEYSGSGDGLWTNSTHSTDSNDGTFAQNSATRSILENFGHSGSFSGGESLDTTHDDNDEWGGTWEDISSETDININQSSKSIYYTTEMNSPSRSGIEKSSTILQSSQTSQKLSKIPAKSKSSMAWHNNPLGTEFDIKSLDIKTAPRKTSDQEFDFFADMTPKINSTATSLLDVLAEMSLDKPGSGNTKENSLHGSSLFQVKQADMDLAAADGWEDESADTLDEELQLRIEQYGNKFT